MASEGRQRLSFWRGMFYLLMALGMGIAVVRFRSGLGSVTNLSDRFPWGLWVGFDCLCGVGLAAGGFVITGVVYVFNVKRFQPIVRPVIVTAFLGYLLEVVALMFDLGRPWNLWHPLVMWNPHSVMFAVAWCVMLYTVVLGLEFSGMVFEKLRWKRATGVLRAVSIPLVVVGVLISVLHQSSLGSLYLIVPEKLHALWYSPMLPALFLVSAVGAGLGMVIVESNLSARAFGRRLEMPLLSEVGRVLVAVLFLYGVFRIYDLAHRGALSLAIGVSYEALMFQLEFLAGVLAPMILLAMPRIRTNTHGLYGSALLVVLGFIVNRLNVSITGFEGAQGGQYVPSWGEAAITLMLIALGFALFALAVKYLNVFPEAPDESPNERTGRLPETRAPAPGMSGSMR